MSTNVGIVSIRVFASLSLAARLHPCDDTSKSAGAPTSCIGHCQRTWRDGKQQTRRIAPRGPRRGVLAPAKGVPQPPCVSCRASPPQRREPSRSDPIHATSMGSRPSAGVGGKRETRDVVDGRSWCGASASRSGPVQESDETLT